MKTANNIVSELLKMVQVSVPFEDLRAKYRDTIIANQIHPEIIIGHAVLDSFAQSDFVSLSEQLLDAGLCCTIHAPFLDLRPGALDPKIRGVSFERIKRCLEVSAFFKPISIVCHHAFDERYYPQKEDEWLANSVLFWQDAIALLPPHSRIALENVYEKTPQEMKRLLEAVNSEKLRFCFDVGHCNCFAGCDYEVWVKELGAYLADVHIHDNRGSHDEHLPPLEGTFPFENFLALLRAEKIKPRVTIEAHNVSRLTRSLKNLEALGLPELLR